VVEIIESDLLVGGSLCSGFPFYDLKLSLKLSLARRTQHRIYDLQAHQSHD